MEEDERLEQPCMWKGVDIVYLLSQHACGMQHCPSEVNDTSEPTCAPFATPTLTCVHMQTASPEERKKFVPRVSIFGGKAASAYYMAKKIVRLVNAVGSVVNADPDVGDLLKAR